MTDFYTLKGFAGHPLEYLMQTFDEVLDGFAHRGKRALSILEIGAGKECWGLPFPIPFDIVPKVLALWRETSPRC